MDVSTPPSKPVDLAVVLARLAAAEEMPLVLGFHRLPMTVEGSGRLDGIRNYEAVFDLRISVDLTAFTTLWQGEEIPLSPFSVESPDGLDCIVRFTSVRKQTRHTIIVPFGHPINRPLFHMMGRLAAKRAATQAATQ